MSIDISGKYRVNYKVILIQYLNKIKFFSIMIYTTL